MTPDTVGPDTIVSRLLLSPDPASEFSDRAPPPAGYVLTRTSIAFSSDGTELVFVGRRPFPRRICGNPVEILWEVWLT